MGENENGMLNYKGLKKILSNIKEFINKNKIKIDDTLTMSEDGTLGVAVPVKPITNAEYEKLGEEEKESNAVWAIMDDIVDSGGGGSSEVYSTKEVRVGTWIDGRPLYRIAGSTTTPSEIEKWTKIYDPIPNLLDVIRLSSYYKPSVNGFQLPHLLSSSGKLIAEISYFQDFNANDTGILCYISDAAYINKPLRYIIEYTKTTDQATTQISDNSLRQEDRPSVEVPEFNTAAVTASIF